MLMFTDIRHTFRRLKNKHKMICTYAHVFFFASEANTVYRSNIRMRDIR